MIIFSAAGGRTLSVLQTFQTCSFPDPLNRIQFSIVERQEAQRKVFEVNLLERLGKRWRFLVSSQ
jgi:hypothetical protein